MVITNWNMCYEKLTANRNTELMGEEGGDNGFPEKGCEMGLQGEKAPVICMRSGD